MFLVLHPQHKLNYFHAASWPSEWIETAEALVCDEFDRTYKNIGLDDEDNLMSRESSESEAEEKVCTSHLPSNSSNRVTRPRRTCSITCQLIRPQDQDPLLMNSTSTSAPQLKEFQSPCFGGTKSATYICSCIIWHWITFQSQVSSQYSISPTFYELILLPATSVEVERLFSCGRLILSHTCSCFSVQSTHDLLCVGSWSLAGLVLDEDMEAMAMLNEIEGKLELDRLVHVLGKTYQGIE